MTFDQTIESVVGIVRKWNEFSYIQEVTIIRDVFGKVALLLEMSTSIDVTEKEALHDAMSKSLKQYYQGKIYYKSECKSDLIRIMIDEIEKERWKYDATDCMWYLLERAIAKKAWIQCDYRESAIWKYEEAARGNKPKVVTFYSFKGGMGRTTALAATALCLAQKGKNVLLIDTDIEAPGLISLFLDEGDVRRGTVDYLLEANLNRCAVNMEDYILSINDPVLMEGLSGKLFAIPSGVMDQDYLQKLARIDFQDTVQGNLKGLLCGLIEDAVESIEKLYKVDYILLDARAGFHDMGGVVTTQIPHGVVAFGKDSKQSWQGMQLVINSIGAVQKEQPFLAVVDSACGQNGMISAVEKQTFTSQIYTICSEYYYSEDESQPGIDATGEAHTPVFVPYQSILSSDIQLYTDGTTQKKEFLEQVKGFLLGSGYQEIGDRIRQWFSDGE